MKIIVDTSILSEFLRRKKTPDEKQKSFLATLIENEEIILLGIILQEILSGITSKKLYEKIKEVLVDLAYIEPVKNDYLKASYLRNQLLKKGVTTGTVDILIASIAISNNCYLLANDNDFKHIAKYSDLKLLTPEKYKKTSKKKNIRKYFK